MKNEPKMLTLGERTTDRWLTVSELAKELNISQATIRRRIKDGTIKAMKLFGIIRVPESQFYRNEPTNQERRTK